MVEELEHLEETRAYMGREHRRVVSEPNPGPSRASCCATMQYHV